MIEFPADLLAAIPPGSVAVAQRWWSTLSDDQRRQVAGLWDERLEVRFFTPQRDEAGRLDDWEDVPVVRGGRFIPADDAWGLAEWGPGYFEHLLQHPELMLLWQPAERTFHIGCTRHPAARDCLETGSVPVTFTCPASSRSCPLMPLRGASLSRGRARSNGMAGHYSLSRLTVPRCKPTEK
jgi:hypothetical protein